MTNDDPLTKARAELEALEPEVDNLRSAWEAKSKRADALRQFISFGERLYPPKVAFEAHGEAVASVVDLTAEKAVLSILANGGTWTPSDMAQELMSQGWTTASSKPEVIAAGALSRLSKNGSGEVIKVGHGRYAASTFLDPPGAVSSEGNQTSQGTS